MRIVVDAMGGDAAPREIVRGAVRAAAMTDCPDLILAGDEKTVTHELDASLGDVPPAERSRVRGHISITHAPEVVEMHEHAVEGLRKKKNTSIARCVELVREGEAQALVTAGHTGAAVAATMLGLKLLPGIRRPGIAVTMPARNRACTLIDVGANIAAKPIHLLHYGVMASNLSRYLLGIDNPSVGLVNIGSEDAKGTNLVRQTKDLFEGSPLNFIGNIEGQDLFSGRCDIAVCEGFVGNVVLKVTEGFASSLLDTLRDEIRSHVTDPTERLVWEKALSKIEGRMDYAEYGGALLLGIDGICVICHGRSDARAISNAIRMAKTFIQLDVNAHIVSGLQSL
ncbi:MAG: phosphate acyltransferase PlsX [Planctomycetes bacterium]|nr:phosphate acyltransferase PlsX [Planctomycetota bacterium]MBI3844643.1 phosphate acyltransferase PlsX [Planctomycetota bacterium]